MNVRTTDASTAIAHRMGFENRRGGSDRLKWTDEAGNTFTVEFGTDRPFVPSYYGDNEKIIADMSEYSDHMGNPIPSTIDYYSPKGNFRLHSNFMGMDKLPRKSLLNGRNFIMRDVAHTELVSSKNAIDAMMKEVSILARIIRTGRKSDLARFI